MTITLASGTLTGSSIDSPFAFGLWSNQVTVGIELAEARRTRRPVLRRLAAAADAAAGVGAASATGQSFFAAVGRANGSGTVMAVSAAASILPTGKWLAVTARRLRDEKKYVEGTTKRELADVLDAESKTAVKAGQLGHTLEPCYLRNHLKPLGIWPLSSLK